MRLLLVEDDAKLARAVERGLRHEGYAVDVAGDGDAALMQAAVWEYDAIVLDVMLPSRDGFEVCRLLRERDCWAPILMLTARGQVGDRIRGLDVGADDYLAKPFDFGELLARLRALVRRAPAQRPAAPGGRRPRRRPRDARGGPGRRARGADGARVRGARVPGPPRRRGDHPRARCSTTSGTRTSRARPTSSTCTSGTCAGSSSSPSTARSSARSAAWAMRWRPNREAADPRPHDRVVRRPARRHRRRGRGVPGRPTALGPHRCHRPHAASGRRPDRRRLPRRGRARGDRRRAQRAHRRAPRSADPGPVGARGGVVRRSGGPRADADARRRRPRAARRRADPDRRARARRPALPAGRAPDRAARTPAGGRRRRVDGDHRPLRAQGPRPAPDRRPGRAAGHRARGLVAGAPGAAPDRPHDRARSGHRPPPASRTASSFRAPATRSRIWRPR